MRFRRSSLALAALLGSGCAHRLPTWDDFQNGRRIEGIDLDNSASVPPAIASLPMDGRWNLADATWGGVGRDNPVAETMTLKQNRVAPDSAADFYPVTFVFYFRPGWRQAPGPIPAVSYELQPYWAPIAKGEFRRQAVQLGIEIKPLVGVSDLGPLYETSLRECYATLERWQVPEGPMVTRVARVLRVRAPDRDWFLGMIHFKSVAAIRADIERTAAEGDPKALAEAVKPLALVPTNDAKELLALAERAASSAAIRSRAAFNSAASLSRSASRARMRTALSVSREGSGVARGGDFRATVGARPGLTAGFLLCRRGGSAIGQFLLAGRHWIKRAPEWP